MIVKGAAAGGTIALVAPSSPFDPALVAKGRDMLEQAGYRTVAGKNLSRLLETSMLPASDTRYPAPDIRHPIPAACLPYLAGSDRERAQDLCDAFSDPEVSAVVCVRGGYGSGRLLPLLPLDSLSKSGKMFLGHSDITFLHLALAGRAGMCTFHGPNLTGLAEQPERLGSVLDALCGRAAFEWKLGAEQVLRHGRVTGPVLGGNLTCLAHLVGTPYLPDLTGALLLVEDCCEALYRLDRIINHLKLAGILEKLGGILLGEFDRCAENGQICSMVMDHVRAFGFPVVHSLPFGHCLRNDVIPFGVPFLLDTHERVLRVVQNPVSV